MITIFDLLSFLGPLVGLALGIITASSYGVSGALLGAIAGGCVGFYVGRLPFVLMVRREQRKLSKFSAEDLREQLYNPSCWTPQFLLLELRSRGEDIRSELPVVLDLMKSEHSDRRARGFAAFLSAFPEFVGEIKGYNPMCSTEECTEKVNELGIRIQKGDGSESPSGASSDASA